MMSSNFYQGNLLNIVVFCFLALNTFFPALAGEIKVMSFNIRVPVDEPPNDWQARRTAVTQVLNSEVPDVIGFQELVEKQKLDLTKEFPNYVFIGSGREQDGAGESVGLFINTDKFKIDESENGTFWFSNTPDVAGSAHWGNQYLRICSWTRVIDKHTGKGLYVFNSHWDFSPEFQSKAVALLLEKIAQRKYGNDPVVIIGDFNATPESEALEHITANQFSDGWNYHKLRYKKESNGATYHAFNGKAKARIDYILFSSEQLMLESFLIHSQKVDGVWPSDHFPISAVFSY